MNVLVVPDKFKGTLTAAQAADAIARGWRSARPDDVLDLLPMTDGGDGFGDIMSQLLGATPRTVRTVDAAHRPCDSTWTFDVRSSTAVVESARTVGLAQLPPGKYHPFELDTEGLGLVLSSAAKAGARRCLVGIGGSATNDAGFGMARAVGWTFFDKHGEEIVRWTELHNLSQVRPPEQQKLFDELIIAVDVQNTLLGPAGCTRVYGPQKGLRLEEFDFAERCLGQLANILKSELHIDHANLAGAGAAGGLGFGLCSFAGGRLAPGFDLFAKWARLHDRLANKDVVITAEGAVDRQTLMGKGVGQIAALCQQQSIRCIAFAGAFENRDEANNLFWKTAALTDLISTPEAIAHASLWLEKLAANVAREFA